MTKRTAVHANVAFSEKVNIFSRDFLKCCLYISKTEPTRETFTKQLYAKMVSTSKLLEDFLDIHGAKNNVHWYYYRELVSSVRNLSEASYSQKHIAKRLPMYGLEETEGFRERGYTTHKFLISSLRKISQNALTEAERLQIELPKSRFEWDDFPGISTESPLEFEIHLFFPSTACINCNL